MISAEVDERALSNSLSYAVGASLVGTTAGLLPQFGPNLIRLLTGLIQPSDLDVVSGRVSPTPLRHRRTGRRGRDRGARRARGPRGSRRCSVRSRRAEVRGLRRADAVHRGDQGPRGGRAHPQAHRRGHGGTQIREGAGPLRREGRAGGRRLPAGGRRAPGGRAGAVGAGERCGSAMPAGWVQYA